MEISLKLLNLYLKETYKKFDGDLKSSILIVDSNEHIKNHENTVKLKLATNFYDIKFTI